MNKFLALLLALALLTASASALADGTAVIDGHDSDRVHLRKSASVQADSLGLYFTGTSVQCLTDPTRDWVQVTIGEETGWMMGQYLTTGDVAAAVQSRQPVGTVTLSKGSGKVNMRAEPSLQASIVRQCTPGETAVVLGETVDHWYYVRLNGQYGYIRSDYLTLSSSGAASDLTEALADYRGVLMNEYSYVSEEGKMVFLSESEHPFTKFSVLDMDGDGLPEVAVFNEWETLILHHQSDVKDCYGYTLAYRAINQLKADGTFSFSSSAAESGHGRMLFEGPGAYTMDEYACSHSRDDTHAMYFVVHGQEVGEAAFQAELARQDRKTGAVWYDLTQENIRRILTN